MKTGKGAHGDEIVTLWLKRCHGATAGYETQIGWDNRDTLKRGVEPQYVGIAPQRKTASSTFLSVRGS